MKKNMLALAAVVLSCAVGCAKTAPQEEGAADIVAAETVTTANEEEPASSKSVVKTVDATLSGVDAYEAIRKAYEGRVVVVDFWATWCGPCRMAMKTIDAIKPAYMDKGVAFVYITGETSPAEKWAEMIPAIDGDHYRLTKAQWSELCQTLNIPGIPAYAVYNTDGSVAFSNLNDGGYPGNEVISETLDAALTR